MKRLTYKWIGVLILCNKVLRELRQLSALLKAKERWNLLWESYPAKPGSLLIARFPREKQTGSEIQKTGEAFEKGILMICRFIGKNEAQLQVSLSFDERIKELVPVTSAIPILDVQTFSFSRLMHFD